MRAAIRYTLFFCALGFWLSLLYSVEAGEESKHKSSERDNYVFTNEENAWKMGYFEGVDSLLNPRAADGEGWLNCRLWEIMREDEKVIWLGGYAKALEDMKKKGAMDALKINPEAVWPRGLKVGAVIKRIDVGCSRVPIRGKGTLIRNLIAHISVGS